MEILRMLAQGERVLSFGGSLYYCDLGKGAEAEAVHGVLWYSQSPRAL